MVTIQTELSRVLGALPPELGERGAELRYANLPLCVLDAVYSVAAPRAQVENLVERYCAHYDVPCHRPRFDRLPRREEQLTIRDLIGQIEAVGPQRFAAEVLRNRRPTSPGIGRVLRSEAVLAVSYVLDAHGIDVLQDLVGAGASRSLYRELCAVPGQSQGTGIRSLFALAGVGEVITPSPLVRRCFTEALGRPIDAQEAGRLLEEAAAALRPDARWITPAYLDHAIANAERQL
jgi:hypothetical protein